MRLRILFASVLIVLGLRSVEPTAPAPGALSIPPENVLVNDRSTDVAPYIAQREPTLAVAGSRIVVGWNDERYRQSRTVRGINSSVGYAFSTDGGSTFTDAGELGASHWGADPSLAVDRVGRFYFGRIDFRPGSSDLDRIAVYKSTDGGMTFPGSTSASNGLDGNQDKPLVTVDNTGGPFDNNVYASWTNASSNVLNIMFARSTDEGVSFASPIPISNSNLNQGSMTAVGPSGEVYLVWTENGTNIMIRRSTDGGASFAPAVLAVAPNPIGGVQSSQCNFCGEVLKGDLSALNPPIIAVDRSEGPNRGKVYLVFGSAPDLSGNDMTHVYLTSSSDGGNTWSAPLRLNDDTTMNDQWLPFVAVSPNGVVGAMWYDRRLDPENFLIDVFMTMSVDGGASFGPNLRITNVSFPPPGLNLKLGFPPCSCYMSSYNYMVADATSFYLVWTDNRMVNSGLVDPNIVFARVPIGVSPPSPRFPIDPPARRIRLPGVVDRGGR